MGILAAIRREEKKVKKQLAKLQHQLSSLHGAAKALGQSAERSNRRKEARVVGCWESEDCESGEKAVGES